MKSAPDFCSLNIATANAAVAALAALAEIRRRTSDDQFVFLRSAAVVRRSGLGQSFGGSLND
jgi:hypothetical protein